jgi:hypothetical protein
MVISVESNDDDTLVEQTTSSPPPLFFFSSRGYPNGKEEKTLTLDFHFARGERGDADLGEIPTTTRSNSYATWGSS